MFDIQNLPNYLPLLLFFTICPLSYLRSSTTTSQLHPLRLLRKNLTAAMHQTDTAYDLCICAFNYFIS